MSREVKIPKWGLTIEKMTILEWLKGIGDQVDQGEALCEVETDKANSEIEAPVAGTLVGVLPVAILFFVLQRDFIAGLASGAVKG